jgi:hypothetical protein
MNKSNTVKNFCLATLVAATAVLSSCSGIQENKGIQKQEVKNGVIYLDTRDADFDWAYIDKDKDGYLDEKLKFCSKNAKQHCYSWILTDASQEFANISNQSPGGYNVYGDWVDNKTQNISRSSYQAKELQKEFQDVKLVFYDK